MGKRVQRLSCNIHKCMTNLRNFKELKHGNLKKKRAKQKILGGKEHKTKLETSSA